MKNVIDILSRGFRILVLKPFDFLLFGGSGALTVPRAEWQRMIRSDLRAAGSRKGGAYVAGEIDDVPASPKWLTTNLPTVYDGPGGDAFFSDIEK